jgi:4,5-DOPA dioxygenase extradiol
MFPDAEVPVIPLSIQSRGGAEQAYRLGQALHRWPPRVS